MNPTTFRQVPATFLVACAILFISAMSSFAAETETASPAAAEPSKLAVLWTSGDPEVAHRVALMFTNAAKSQNWFEEVRLIIWGPSQRLLVADKDVKAYVEGIQKAGVEVQACINCAESYGLVDQLRALDIEVKPMGEPLAGHLKSAEWKVLTF